MKPFMLLAAAVLGLCTLTGPGHAGVIQTQAPCTTCLTFTNSLPPTPILTASAFNFSAASAGTALVTFNGSLSCTSTHNQFSPLSEINLTTQITTSATTTPDPGKPGSLQLYTTFPLAHDSISLQVATFDLATTLAVKFTAPGAKTFFFNISRHTSLGSISCSVVNAAFTVIFTP